MAGVGGAAAAQGSVAETAALVRGPIGGAATPEGRAMKRGGWAILALALVCLCCGVLAPAFRPLHDRRPAFQSANSLHQIVSALVNYHQTNFRLPPAVVTGKDGK